MPTLFVSTAIPYVNAPPHLGFALEAILADVIARHGCARGEATVFVSGTDDHSVSNVRAADARGVSVQELVDDNGARFRALGPLLDVSFDEFVRTSGDPRHRAAVHALWSAYADRGDLERRRIREALSESGCAALSAVLRAARHNPVDGTAWCGRRWGSAFLSAHASRRSPLRWGGKATGAPRWRPVLRGGARRRLDHAARLSKKRDKSWVNSWAAPSNQVKSPPSRDQPWTSSSIEV